MKLPHRPVSPDSSPVTEALKLVELLAEASARGLAADEQALDDSSELALTEAISEAALSARLRAAVERATSKSDDSMDALRIAVCAFTIALRNDGVTPEGVLIRLKAAIRAETLSPLWDTSSWKGPRLRETITSWCIQDYFRSDECAH